LSAWSSAASGSLQALCEAAPHRSDVDEDGMYMLLCTWNVTNNPVDEELPQHVITCHRLPSYYLCEDECMAGDIRLRDVEDGDLDVLYKYQHEPESSAMAAVPSREREAFMAHTARIRADDSNVYKAIVLDGQVVGDLSCFGEPETREV